jgi:hypothetical protein
LNSEAQPEWPQRIEVAPSDLYLDTENPRHKPVQSEREAIERLCETESIYELAADIADHGINPLELIAVVPAAEGADAARGPYVVAEGNRRLCALKLLADPDAAPAALVEKFRGLAARRPVRTIPAQLFPDRDAARTWLERLHSGSFGGRGRLQWSAEQKTRFLGGGRHARAQALLDIAEREGLITAAQREGKLSIVDRWISNPVFREALGIDFPKGDSGIMFTRPPADRKRLLSTFMDLVKKGEAEGGISTRAKADDMKRKAREISETIRTEAAAGRMQGTTVEPEPWEAAKETAGAAPKGGSAPKKPQHRCLPHSAKIEKALEEYGNQKLRALYFELTKVPLDHVQLLTVGLWTFYEVLTANMGRKEGNLFDNYMNSAKVESMGFTGREQKKSLPRAFKSISDAGNLTKHDSRASQLNREQLYNDVQTLEDVTEAMIRSLLPGAGGAP